MTDETPFDATLRRVRELRNEQDDEAPVYPTPYAFERVMALLNGAFLLSKARPFPRAVACTWEDGSIFLYWIARDHVLHVRVGAAENRSCYIYHREGDDFDIDRDVTPENLARWIDWYAGVDDKEA